MSFPILVYVLRLAFLSSKDIRHLDLEAIQAGVGQSGSVFPLKLWFLWWPFMSLAHTSKQIWVRHALLLLLLLDVGYTLAMIGKNRQLVTNEPVEFEK